MINSTTKLHEQLLSPLLVFLWEYRDDYSYLRCDSDAFKRNVFAFNDVLRTIRQRALKKVRGKLCGYEMASRILTLFDEIDKQSCFLSKQLFLEEYSLPEDLSKNDFCFFKHFVWALYETYNCLAFQEDIVS
ncbi:hypothetical protein [Dipodfec virus UOA04_Rod_682]|nr:hypothetical protein [Dipodfec virus UOA04_Rod_682]